MPRSPPTIHPEEVSDVPRRPADRERPGRDIPDYTASNTDSLTQQGDLSAGGSYTESDDQQTSATGNFSYSDANGGFYGASIGDGDEEISSVSGDPGAGAGGTPPKPTTGTVSTTDQSTALKIPLGDHRVIVIDKGDQGWHDWTVDQKQQYINNNTNMGMTLSSWNPNVANGDNFIRKFTPRGGGINARNGIAQIVKDLATEEAELENPINVLVFVDHGHDNQQQVGQTNYLDPSDVDDSSALNQIVPFVEQGGTLVLTGCSVFTAANLPEWQGYANEYGIYIMGSLTTVVYFKGTGPPTGTWIVLGPGGSPPTIRN